MRQSEHMDGTCSGSNLLSFAFGAMANTPISPEVRAGLMRMLANQPDIEALGSVTDPLGREGVGLRAQFGPVNRDVIFDPDTGDVLALHRVMAKPDAESPDWKRPGRVLNYTAIVDSGWTNQRPEPPR